MVKLKVLRRIFLVYILFLVYMTVIYHRTIDFSWIVTGGFSTLNKLMADTTNLIPFATIRRYLAVLDRPSGLGLFLYNIVANVIVLIPFGYLLPIINKSSKKLWVFALIALVFILTMEGLQYVSMSGTLDVDDVILNLTGALIGFWLCPLRNIPHSTKS